MPALVSFLLFFCLPLVLKSDIQKSFLLVTDIIDRCEILVVITAGVYKFVEVTANQWSIILKPRQGKKCETDKSSLVNKPFFANRKRNKNQNIFTWGNLRMIIHKEAFGTYGQTGGRKAWRNRLVNQGYLPWACEKSGMWNLEEACGWLEKNPEAWQREEITLLLAFQ